MLKIEFKTETDSFIDNREQETIRILKKIVKRIENGEILGICQDLNGNTIGSWDFTLAQNNF